MKDYICQPLLQLDKYILINGIKMEVTCDRYPGPSPEGKEGASLSRLLPSCRLEGCCDGESGRTEVATQTSRGSLAWRVAEYPGRRSLRLAM